MTTPTPTPAPAPLPPDNWQHHVLDGFTGEQRYKLATALTLVLARYLPHNKRPH